MSPFASPQQSDLPTAFERWHRRLRQDFGRKATGLAVALAAEVLLLIALLSLGKVHPERKIAPMATISFDVHEEPDKAPPPPQPQPSAAAQQPRATSSPSEQPQPVPSPAPPPPPAAVIPVSPQQMKTFDLSNLPKAPAPQARSGPIGPAYAPKFGDSQRVGTAPNGQSMYAASWYREPTDQELRGYLSTAQVPAWGMIVCKTVEDYRVDDCQGLDEYPEGSHMIRAMLAAAWQFRVRPPRVNGVSQIGDWVRIRFDYTEAKASPYGTMRELPGPGN